MKGKIRRACRRGAVCLMALCIALCLSSCNGTGASEDLGGVVYGKPSSSSGQGYTADDFVSAMGSGNTDIILVFFREGSGSGSAGATNEVALDAAEIGLPSGGSVFMTITGEGLEDWSGEAEAGADGKVRFRIPLIASGSEVTVSMEVRDAGGNVVSSGSKTQTVEGDGSEIYVSLSGGTPAPATPGGTVTCSGIAVQGAENTWYVNDNTNLGMTTLTFSTTARPEWVEYNWFVGGSSRWGWGDAADHGTNLGALGVSFSGSDDITVEAYCVARLDDGTEVTGDTVTLTFRKRPPFDSSKISMSFSGGSIANGDNISLPATGYDAYTLALAYDTTGLPAGSAVSWTVTGTPGSACTEAGASKTIGFGDFLGPLGPTDGGWHVSVSCSLTLPGGLVISGGASFDSNYY